MDRGATNVDLSEMAARGRFKRDLLDRLSFEVRFLPPLRERREDIELLAAHFVVRMAFELGRDEIPEPAEEAIERLCNYPWPGNIRELKNAIERAVYRAGEPVIYDIDFDPFRSPVVAGPGACVAYPAGRASGRPTRSASGRFRWRRAVHKRRPSRLAFRDRLQRPAPGVPAGAGTLFPEARPQKRPLQSTHRRQEPGADL
jgi:DNA-binding NtrC family response regulator